MAQVAAPHTAVAAPESPCTGEPPLMRRFCVDGRQCYRSGSGANQRARSGSRHPCLFRRAGRTCELPELITKEAVRALEVTACGAARQALAPPPMRAGQSRVQRALGCAHSQHLAP